MDWQREAERRGLPNNRNMVEAWRDFDSDKNVALFQRHGVMSEAEILARKNIHLDEYARTILVEGQIASQMGHTM